MPIAPTIQRFNLICHGLMWFWRENKDLIRILIPEEPGHVYKAGAGEKLEDLPSSRFELRGVQRGGITTKRLTAGFGLPCVRRELVELGEQPRTEIVVPLPDVVRSYNHAESVGIKFIEKRQADAILLLPDAVATTVVLSWFKVVQKSVRLTDGKTVFKSSAVRESVSNLAIYAQEQSREKPPKNHGDAFNRLVVYAKTKEPLTLNVTSQKLYPDSPPVATAIGLQRVELTPLVDLFRATTNATGCVGAASPEDGFSDQ